MSIRWGEHAALLVGATTVAFAGVRLLAIARFDTATAAAILQATGTGNVIVGTLLSLLPFVVALVTVLCSVVVFVDHSWCPLPRATMQWMLYIGCALTLFIVPLLLATIVVALGAAMAITRWRRHGRADPDIRTLLTRSRFLRVEARVLLTFTVLAALVVPTPWLSLEQVTTANGSTLVGYIAGESQEELVLLLDNNRAIRLVSKSDVTARTLCRGAAGPTGALGGRRPILLSGSLASRLLYPNRSPAYPRCKTKVAPP